MQDHFMEEVVVKHKNGFNRALYLLSWVIIGLSGLTAAIMFSGVSSSLVHGGIHWPSVLMFVLCVVCSVNKIGITVFCLTIKTLYVLWFIAQGFCDGID